MERENHVKSDRDSNSNSNREIKSKCDKRVGPKTQ